MVDYFSLAVSHGLIMLVLWRLLFRPDLDVEAGVEADDRPGMRDRSGA